MGNEMTNEELEYQIKVQRNKLATLGVNTEGFEYDIPSHS